MNVKYHKPVEDMTFNDIFEGIKNVKLVGYQNKYKERFRIKYHREIIKIFKTKIFDKVDVLILKKEDLAKEKEVIEKFFNMK